MRRLITIGVVAVIAIAIVAVALKASAGEPEREITLVARDMAFYLPEGGAPNPPLELARGESARLTLINRDRGIEHDLAVESLDLEIGAIPGDGASRTVELRAPREAGDHEYVCRLHDRMMRGRLIIR